MPFAAVAGGVASAAVGAGIGALTKSSASGSISEGQQQANAALQPWVTSGTAANTQQNNLLGLNGQPAADTAMQSFQSSPGYAYDVQQGIAGVDAGAASKGILTSGQTIKAEQTEGTNLANQNFQQYYNNLNGLSSQGVSAAGGQAGTDTSAAGQQASLTNGLGGTLGNSLGGVAGTVQNSLSSMFGSSNNGGQIGSDTNQAVVSAPNSLAANGGQDVGSWDT